MPQMQLLRLGDLNLIYLIKEIMEDNGFTNGSYDVLDGYLSASDFNKSQILPTVTVEIDYLYGRDVELGSKQWPSLAVSIDVFAKTDTQRDDIAYILWTNLNETGHNLYDFNSAFPSAVGDYSGISSIGTYSIDQLTISYLEPEDSTFEGAKHRAVLDGYVNLPNI